MLRLLSLLVALMCLAPAPVAAQSADEFVLQATALAASGDWAAALPLLDQAISQDPEHARALYYRALCHLKLGQIEAAATDLERFEAVAPSNSESELAAALRVQIEAALPAEPPVSPGPRAGAPKVGPELPLLLIGGATVGLGAGLLANGLLRADRGIERDDRGQWADGRVPYNLGIGLIIGGGATMAVAIPVGVAWHKPGQAQASVSVAAGGSPEAVHLGVGVTW